MGSNTCSRELAGRLDGLSAEALRVLAGAALARAAGEPLDGGVGDGELVASVAGWHRLMTAAHAEVLRRVGEVERRQAFRGQAMSSTSLWVQRLGVSRAEARTLVDTAGVLARMPGTAALHAQGHLGTGHVTDAARTVAQLDRLAAQTPADGDDSTATHTTAAEAVAALDAAVVAQAAATRAGGDAPDSAPDADAGADDGENADAGAGAGVVPVARGELRRGLEEFTRERAPGLLAGREQRLRAQRGLRLGRDLRDADQAPILEGRLAPLTYAKARTVLHALARKHATGDPRTFAQRCHDAFDRVLDIALASGELPDVAGEQPRVLLLVDADTLHERAGAPPGTLDGYGQISAETARQICCDAQITAVATGAAGAVLDVGRDRRAPNRAQRRATFARDGGCVGCAAPLADCQIHHIHYWEHGGSTDIDNLVAVCWDCHARIHHCGWHLRRQPDGQWRLRPPHEHAREHPGADTHQRMHPPQRQASRPDTRPPRSGSRTRLLPSPAPSAVLAGGERTLPRGGEAK